jgi:GNAT superfamily N-acetyltransferase
VGSRRADAAPLTDRAWPFAVRRARANDREAIVEFASRTFDGWDYLPHAFDAWLNARDGVLLVATAGRPADGSKASAANGDALEHGQVIAVARVALMSPAEAWLEGIRVDPRVRGLSVATNLQAAELQWAAAQRVRVAVSYKHIRAHETSAHLGCRLMGL